MLTPINVAGPDARRKQIVARLSQQAQQNGAARSAVPMPIGQHGNAAALGGGTGFRAGMAHALPGVQNTQDPNILASILAKLGIGGRPQDNEVSGGFGAPVSPYGPNYLPPPIPVGGNPIPVGGSPLPPSGQALDQMPPASSAGVAAVDRGASLIGAPQALPPGISALNSGVLSGPVPLGGGHFYDPTSGQIIFNPSGGGAAGLTYGKTGVQ